MAYTQPALVNHQYSPGDVVGRLNAGRAFLSQPAFDDLREALMANMRETLRLIDELMAQRPQQPVALLMPTRAIGSKSSTGRFVTDDVREHPGSTTQEIVDRVMAAHGITDGGVRSALTRARRDGVVAREGKHRAYTYSLKVATPPAAAQKERASGAKAVRSRVTARDSILIDDVREHPSTSVAQAARRLGLKHNSVQKAFARLIKAGTIVRGGSCGCNGRAETYTFTINEAATAPQEPR